MNSISYLYNKAHLDNRHPIVYFSENVILVKLALTKNVY